MYAVVIKKEQIFALFNYKIDAENFTLYDYDLSDKRVKEVEVTIKEKG